MGIEGSLKIQLKTGNGAANVVSIESSRPVYASMVFRGKSIAETLDMIPLLFNICGTAQACAGVRACEKALGIQVSARVEQLRDSLVNMETLREHLWRILLDWPAFNRGEPDRLEMAKVMETQKNYQQALCPDGNAFQLGGTDCKPDPLALNVAIEQFAALLQRKVFAMPAVEWLAITGQRAFDDWGLAGETIAAGFINQIIQAGWSSAGACESEALPELSELQLYQAMQDADFVKQPQLFGQCYETTSLTRVDCQLLKELKQKFGNGLLVRVVARLTEIARLASGQLLFDTGDADDYKNSSVSPTNPGIGQAAAARGQLIHRVEVNGDRIANYQILAPTEWNFHQRGVVAQALSTLKGDPDQVKQQARLLINAIDPCVGYELSIV